MKKFILLVLMLFAASVFSKQIVLSEDNTLVLNESFNKNSITSLISQAKELDSSLESDYPIYLVLNTPGGSIQAGLELFEFLRGINRPVHTITLFAASMGFQTVQNLGKRYIVKYGVLMSHYARGGSSGNFGGTDMPSNKKSYDKLWQRRIDMLDQKTVERTNEKQTLDSYRKAYSFDLWLNGQEAVNQGYADEVVTVRCNETLQGTREEEVETLLFTISAVFSKCPLITTPLSIEAILFTNKGKVSLKDFIRNGGVFGETECKENSTCLINPNLRLEDVQKAVNEKEEFFNRNLEDFIDYSY